MVPLLFISSCLTKKHRSCLIWGPVPIINNKYWSNALKRNGHESLTLVSTVYPINSREDFDIYYADLVPKIVPGALREFMSRFFAFHYIINNASVLHCPFSGGPLGDTPIWFIEGFFFRKFGIKTVIIHYGADMYAYSTISDASLRHALLMSYPLAARDEPAIRNRLNYWTKYADIIIPGLSHDGFGRWDCLTGNPIIIDHNQWREKQSYSNNNGINGPVIIAHTPNHRGFKGTEFLLHAVSELQAEGLQIHLELIEKKPNEEVRRILQGVDILAEQFIVGYGLSAIEGMCTGLPVLSNLDSPQMFSIYRRYAYLNECPIVSTTPETLKENIRVLVTHPELRKQLGYAGREYVKKYHSEQFCLFLFDNIYAKIRGEDVNLMTLFHPISSEYVNKYSKVRHPLQENRIPLEYF